MTDQHEPTPRRRTTVTTGMPEDAPTTSASATTAASPSAVWPLLVDPSTPAPFSDEFEGASWKPTEGVEPPQLGARFIGRNSAGERSWTTLATVTVHDEPHRFGWTVQALDDPVSDWTFTLSPLDGPDEMDEPDRPDGQEDGAGCRLTLTCRLGPSELSGLVQAVARHPDREAEFTAGRLAQLRESMQRTVDGIARLAEQAGP